MDLKEDYKQSIASNSYIGKKGYTISKKNLTKDDLEFLYKELFVKPQIFGQNRNPTEFSSFPVYRESDNKIYIPRFYGIQRYGLPDRDNITPGDDINVDFAKSLRDYQENIINIYLNYVKSTVSKKSDSINGNGAILEVPCGRGKCLGRDTPIMMYDGTIKMVQDIKVGDVIMGDDSTPRNVLSLARGKEQMYKVIPKKGDPYVVNESHILSLKYSSAVNKNTPKGTVRDISVLDYLDLPKSYHGKGGVLVGYRVPITFPKKEVGLDPYLLGYWLGDGNSRGVGISTQESCVLKYLTENTFVNKHPSLYLQYTGLQYDYRINSYNKIEKGSNEFMNYLRKYDLIKNKHIPHDYKCNDRKTQLELLAGIIDSDGCSSCNSYDIIQKNERLLDDIIFIARSLGFAAYKSVCKKSCMYKGEKKEGTYYRTCIHGKGLDEIPLKCLRKKVEPRKQIKDALNTRIQLEKLSIDNYYGFEIDGNRRFVMGDFTVTHNTVMALKIISELAKKTLIIVHKEFLMDQWIERIKEFLPTATVGKIQGQTFDIQDKDIVIGMVQTMYDRQYQENAFSSFGLTVIDEVHRIGSEQFSKTLFKTITPYMLGISATVERKDKLTKILYMFIGDRIYSEERKDEDAVEVRAIQYKTNDPDFNEVELDFRGNTKFSSMIKKLCDFNYRSDFIVDIVKDLICECNDSQIMILCHNRSLLKYLHDAIEHRKIASVGFYVGGMKKEDLQETESKQIVLATYAMAAEALDIKTLSILIMATPKTDITQSVGRILRVKHEKPIIIDMVDSHDVFQSQWQKRKTFYRKCKYNIIQVESTKYKGEETEWKNIFNPKKNEKEKEPKPTCLIDNSIFHNI
jgi:superfamily II DNA or RNA helicase